MPPPPPPSKSYLLVLDTDSEDDDQDDRRYDEALRRHGSASIVLPKDVTLVELPEHHDYDHIEPTASSSSSSSALAPLTKSFQESNLISPVKEHGRDDDDDDGLEEDLEIIHSESPDSTSQSCDMLSQSKPCTNKNNKKRRKRRRGNKHATTTTTNSNMPKNVSFGTVHIRRFERTLGGDGIPADGGWPLGLGNIIRGSSDDDDDDEMPIPVQEYDARVQQELQTRWRALFPTELEQPPPAILETRQWDYKRDRNAKGNSIRNPLFGSLTEDQRNNLLVHGKATFSKISSSSSNKKKNAGTTNGRPRASSMDQNSARGSSAPMMTRNTSNGGNNHTSSGRPRSQSIDLNAGPFDPIHVRHVRKELEDLRHERSKSDEGCSCRKLQVNSKKMSASKVREELRKRHALPINGSTTVSSTSTRLELENLLRRLVEEEPCCSSQNDCPCVKYGLGCQADACSCWNHRNEEKPKSVLEIKERCRNKFGMYAVDFEYIDRYRKSMLCQVIS